MRESASWLIMFILGLALIVVGFQGALGKVLACIVEPQLVIVK